MRATFVSLLFTLMLGGGCAQPPSAHIEVRRLAGPRPAQVALRCAAEGVRGPRELRWKLAPGVRVVGGNVPQDEPQLLVTLPEPKAFSNRSLYTECSESLRSTPSRGCAISIGLITGSKAWRERIFTG